MGLYFTIILLSCSPFKKKNEIFVKVQSHFYAIDTEDKLLSKRASEIIL